MRTLLSLVSFLFSFIPQIAFADDSQFQRFLVDNKVSIQIPKHWHLNDENRRRDLAAASEARSGKFNHVASLSANSLPRPSGGIIRVSLIKTDELTQASFVDAIKKNTDLLKKELTNEIQNEFKTLKSVMEKDNISILNGPSIELIKIGEKFGFAVIYRRTNASDNSTFLVSQFHIPLNREKALITLSYREQDKIVYEAIMKHVRDTISFPKTPN